MKILESQKTKIARRHCKSQRSPGISYTVASTARMLCHRGFCTGCAEARRAAAGAAGAMGWGIRSTGQAKGEARSACH